MQARAKYFGLIVGLGLISSFALIKAKPAAAAGITCPLAGRPPITGVYGADRPGHTHAGVDISVPAGTPVYAAQSGNIIFAGNNDPNGYGNQIDLAGSDFTFRYGHLQGFVRAGGFVNAGELIAYADTTGSATGSHLHWEMRTDGGGYGFAGTVDPTPYYNNCGDPGSAAPPPAPAPPPGTIQGYKVSDGFSRPDNALVSIVDSNTGAGIGASDRNNPYFLVGLPAGNYRLHAEVPAGWRLLGYTACTNSTTCHNNPPTPGNDPVFSVPSGGSVDVYWHYSLERISLINGCGALYVKEGGLDHSFAVQTNCNDARATALAANRVALINGCGSLYVKEGPLNSPWRLQTNCNDARAADISSNRIAVINGCGSLYVKEGGVGAGGFQQQTGCNDAKATALSGARTAVINSCSSLYVKEGALNGPFNQQVGCNDARATALSGGRIAVINGCGSLYVKEPGLFSPFHQQTGCNDARAVALSGGVNGRLALINGCGALYVKEGDLGQPFHQQTNCNDAQGMAISPTRVAVINSCGSLYVKEGALSSPFHQQTNCGDAKAVALSGN